MTLFERFGKILLFVAGLAVLLDLLGPSRMERWSQSAMGQRRRLEKRLRRLETAKHLNRVVEACAMSVASETYDTSNPYISSAELAQIGAPAREEYLQSQPFSRFTRRFAEPRLIAGSREVTESIRELLVLKLNNEEKEAFERHSSEYSRHERRTWLLLNLLYLLVIPGAVSIYQTMPKGGVVAFSLAFLIAGFIPMFLTAFLLSTRVVLIYQLTTATLRFRLARTALRLIGEDNSARPMRWAALFVFMAGSMLDLVGSW